MDLSVIIVSYRGWDRLLKCLGSLDSFTGKEFSMEVIVVDNNSGDERLDEIEKKYPHFRFIRNKTNGGYANGCNLGAASAKGTYILILNPDTVVSEKETEKLIKAVSSDPHFFIISCRQVREDGKESRSAGAFPGLFRKKKSSAKDEGALKSDIIFPDWISGSVMMFRKEIFDRLNGFDEDFWMYYEDVDICLRARETGGGIAVFRNIVIEHNHGGSSRINPSVTSVTKSEVQASRHIYIHKHKKGAERFLLHFLTIIDNLFIGIITGAAGLIFFFVPKLFVRFLLLIRLAQYYIRAMLKGTWVSRRSVNYQKHIR